MSEPFIGQISVVGFNYAPRGWAFCNGQLLAISQNQALFSILGTTYGGNGTTTFALPDLRGRAAMHWDGTYPLGARGGSESVTLTSTQIPTHTHVPRGIAAGGTVSSPGTAVWAGSDKNDLQYDALAVADTTMAPAASGMGGGGQPHNNMPPVTTLNFIIALVGIFPSRG